MWFILSISIKRNLNLTKMIGKLNESLNIPSKGSIPTGIYLLKVNNRNTKTRSEICSKLTIKIKKDCKKRLWQRCFRVDFVKFLRAIILQNTCFYLKLKPVIT